jgi:hypothetical protein
MRSAAAQGLFFFRPRVVMRSESEVNWIGGICALAVVTLVVAFVTDLRMTSCHAGSLYSIVAFCKPNRWARDRSPASYSHAAVSSSDFSAHHLNSFVFPKTRSGISHGG